MYQVLESILPHLGSDNSFGPWFLFGISVVIGFYLLTKGGDWLSDHCSNLASSLGVPSVIIGLTIVSIATSAPELFTSVAALRNHSTGMILGNVIGSNIANIGLILGISLVIKPIEAKGVIPTSQIFLLFGLTIFFSIALIIQGDQGIGWGIGSILLIYIFAYLFFITLVAIRSSTVNHQTNEDGPSNPVILSLAMIVFATIALWVGSDALVFGAKNFALSAGIPEELIGFTLIALGTSLPELAASLALLKKGESGMLLGNVLGSNMFNIGLVGGVAGVLGPVLSNTPYPWIDYLFMILLTALFCFWLRGRKIEKKEGYILLALYVIATSTTWTLNG